MEKTRHEPIGLLIGAMRRRIKQLTATVAKEHRLSPQQFWILIAIARGEPLSLRQLAEERRMDGPTACRVVDALVKRGLVLSEADPGDRRRTRLALTRPGGLLASRLLPIADDIRDTVESPLSTREREAVVSGLRKMLSNLDRQVERAAARTAAVPRQSPAPPRSIARPALAGRSLRRGAS
jgi:DNA-binding MarR family transcriptional regulator